MSDLIPTNRVLLCVKRDEVRGKSEYQLRMIPPEGRFRVLHECLVAGEPGAIIHKGEVFIKREMFFPGQLRVYEFVDSLEVG